MKKVQRLFKLTTDINENDENTRYLLKKSYNNLSSRKIYKTNNNIAFTQLDLNYNNGTKRELSKQKSQLKTKLKNRLNSLKFTQNIEQSTLCDIIKQQINKTKNKPVKTMETLAQILVYSQKIIDQVYSYPQVEIAIEKLQLLAKETGSKTVIFQCYAISGMILNIYGSYSLSVFYLDKALKKLYQREIIEMAHRHKQLMIYKSITKIFLQKNQYSQSKQFAYKYLRKAWYLNNLEEQLSAYDILGKVYHELQDKSMSKFFHNKMCKGQSQGPQIIKLSNYELQKDEKQKLEFAVYQTIDIFVQKDKSFHQMLEDRYYMKNKNFEQEKIGYNTQSFFFHTHRSPNRNLNSYRLLERKMIRQKKSKQLHFIKPKETIRLKKILNQFEKIMLEVKKFYRIFTQKFGNLNKQNQIFQKSLLSPLKFQATT